MRMVLNREERDFLNAQLICRKDDFQREMNEGIKTTTRLKELNFIMETLGKGLMLIEESR